ncbi:cation-translocating P-type ATPase [Clostridium sp. A1-XYC3]|uniref:P-type Cu(+) transporter n=1 Tax=Clostridium tanneri TaxID=3037988 RepID=A0ABU4JW48_9CLOT|nr:cation-translocating P-type ATPase [Clostridium sp. A1-XYC3]MDW8802376.1 cation-translocating P-type ATPase [Clostridium sp. A1-XYC3]
MSFCRMEVVKSLPGRLRVRIKGLKGNRYFAEAIESTLKRNEKIFVVTANPQTGKALILFDSRQVSVNKLYQEIGSSLETMISKVISSRADKLHEKALNRKTKEIKVFEPEDLPIESQISKVTLSGGLLLALTVKRIFFGKSSMARSSGINNLAALTTIATGYPIFRSGLESLVKRRKLNNDFLISAATVVSLLLKESITGLVVVWLVNLSTLFQTMTLDKSRKAIKQMLQGKDEMAWLLLDGTEISVPIESIEKGNIVIVHIGEKIPIDGEVTDGEAAVSQAIITGEAIPVAKKQGDKVFAGSIVEQGTIKILAEKVGKETSIARIVQLVDEASKVKAPIENMADRYSEKIVPLSLGLSLLNYLVTRDFKRSMTMLIVACPCAAGLATPTAISASMGNAAKRGILIRGGNYLEKVGKTDVVLFDKTGTLTEGNPSVVTIEAVHEDYSADLVLQLAASVENHTNHPLAKAILEKANEINASILPTDTQVVIIGQGVKGIVNKSVVMVGNELFMKNNGININKDRVKADRMKLLGQTVLFIACENELIGMIGVKDKVRYESNRAIKGLREEGICNIGLVTGDCAETGEMIKEELGLDQMWANTLPEQKLSIVEKYQGEGKIVTMVGEGINDSPALAKADIGIAMGTGGTDVAIESADIVLADDNPEKIVTLVKLSNHTMEVVKQNFIFAVGINAIGLILGAGKIISPLSAAILHNLSTFGVVVNSSRLMNYSIDKKRRRRTIGRTKGFRK